MKLYKAIVYCSLIYTIIFSTSVNAFEGPLQTRNQFPIFMHIDAPYLESAATENSFSASLSHSSVYMLQQSPQWLVNLYLEWTELNLRYKKDIPDIFEVGIDVPIMRLTAGFMDGFLSGYHTTFNFPDYGRSSRPKNAFLYDVRKEGALVIQGEEDKTAFGDVRLSLKKKVLQRDPIVSILLNIELPTGDASTGFGSGSADCGAAVLVNNTINERLNMYSNLGVVIPGQFKGQVSIPLRPYYYAGVGLEAAPWPKISLLGQVFVQTSPFPITGISVIDDTAALLVLGGRYISGRDSFELSLTEDLNTTGAPDFTMNLTYKLKM